MIKFIKRREVWCLTGVGWALILVLLAVLSAILFKSIYPFLSLSDPVDSDVLVVEGWIADESVEKLLDIFREDGYRYVVATGIPVTHGATLLVCDNYAELTRLRLLAAGLSPEAALAAPADEAHRNRTRAMATALKSFLDEGKVETERVNLFSEGAHARRSRDTYRSVLQPEYEVGVIAVSPPGYNAEDWWRCSEGVRSVLSETLGLIYNELYLVFNGSDAGMVLIYILGALLGYLLGAIPFGFVIGKLRGVDVRRVGSGNIGATNVFRTVGRNWGILALALDFMKGLIAAYLIPLLLLEGFGGDAPYLIGLTCGCAAILGHNYSIYLKLRGGKGIATSAGMLAGVAPLPFACGVAVWAIVFLALRYVSLASIVAAAAVAAAGWIFRAGEGVTLPIVLSAIAVMVILRHHANIKRLLSGTENRVNFRGRKAHE